MDKSIKELALEVAVRLYVDGEPLALLRDPAHAVLIAREERRKMN